jgi:serine/threonine protein kinase
VLDFGLAKAVSGHSGAGVMQTPTLPVDDTREGVILGTAAFMSPEQARGNPVDKRTDIWAFACVLFEMLIGRPAFAGATVTDTLAAIIEREPPWDELPGAVPAPVRRLSQRCLAKDPRRRLHDIADARLGA